MHIHANMLGTTGECNKLRHRNQDLQRTLAQKVKDHARTQELYDKARGRGQMEHIEQAAESAADRTIMASTAPNRYVDHFGNIANDENQAMGRTLSMPMPPPSMQLPLGETRNRQRPMTALDGVNSQGISALQDTTSCMTNSAQKATSPASQKLRRPTARGSILVPTSGLVCQTIRAA